MARDALRDRQNAFEQAYAKKVDDVLLQQLRDKMEAEERKRAIAEITNISDESILDKLVELNICAETVLALTLVPLVRVAWADGDMDPRERTAVLQATEGMGYRQGTSSYLVVEAWLTENPGDAVYDAWKEYIQALLEDAFPESKAAMRQNLLGRARKVAEAAGGVLGLNKIAASEQAVLDELQEVLS